MRLTLKEISLCLITRNYFENFVTFYLVIKTLRYNMQKCLNQPTQHVVRPCISFDIQETRQYGAPDRYVGKNHVDGPCGYRLSAVLLVCRERSESQSQQTQQDGSSLPLQRGDRQGEGDIPSQDTDGSSWSPRE